MNELFVDELVDLINDFEVDTKPHFGKVLNRLRDDQTTLRSTATTCLCLLASQTKHTQHTTSNWSCRDSPDGHSVP